MNLIENLIYAFDSQLEQASEIGKQLQVHKPDWEIKNIVIAGLGGSGIGGSLVKALLFNEIEIPIEVIKSYDVPRFVNENTLFIASSHSGNTEETLAALETALIRKAHVACITTGGKIHQLSIARNLDLAKVPFEEPCPRQYLAYSLVLQCFLLGHYGLIDLSKVQHSIEAGIARVRNERSAIQAEARLIAARLYNKLPFIYADEPWSALATRFQQQINENAKQVCHVNVFPEMNHNELVGWLKPESILKQAAVVYLRSSLDHPRVATRMEICKPIFQQLAGKPAEITLQGDSRLEQVIYGLHITDWISYYLAENNGVDAYQIDVINHLKNELAKL